MYAGWIVLVVGLVVGLAGVAYPVSSTSSQTLNILPLYSYSVDGNDYHSQGFYFTTGETVQVSARMNVSTIFNLEIMNTTQYRNFYGCAPACRPPFSNGTGISPAALLNVTVTPTQSYSSPFTDPKSDTYYFVFDNSVGTNQSEYTACFGPQGVCNGPAATGTFSLTQSKSLASYSTNWTFVGPGVLLLIVGGAVASMPGSTKKMKPAEPMAA
jgi:hypothetical protein